MILIDSDMKNVAPLVRNAMTELADQLKVLRWSIYAELFLKFTTGVELIGLIWCHDTSCSEIDASRVIFLLHRPHLNNKFVILILDEDKASSCPQAPLIVFLAGNLSNWRICLAINHNDSLVLAFVRASVQIREGPLAQIESDSINSVDKFLCVGKHSCWNLE